MRLVAAFALLLLVGLLFGASMFVYAAYALAALYFINRTLTRRWTESMSAVRNISEIESEIGDTVTVALKLTNKDSWPVAWTLVEDLLPPAALVGPPPALSIDGENLRMCSVPAKGNRILTYKLTALRRGYFQIGPLVAETGDLFGLQRRFRTITKPHYWLVLPKVIPLHGYEVASRRPVGEVRVTYRLMEDPTLVSGIRAYQNGDPLRSVHWRATARTGTLQCKQFEPTTVAGATIVVDLHRASNPDHHEPMRSDLAVTAAASIAHTLMQMQQQFGLLSNGRDAVDRIAEEQQLREYGSRESLRSASAMKTKSDRLRPVHIPTARGPEVFTEMLKTLARLERTDGLKLPELLFEGGSRLPRDATVLVIVQEVDESAALALGMLRRQGYSVSTIVNNFDNEAYHQAVGRLLAQHIPVYHLYDEGSVPEICKQLVLR